MFRHRRQRKKTAPFSSRASSGFLCLSARQCKRARDQGLGEAGARKERGDEEEALAVPREENESEERRERERAVRRRERVFFSQRDSLFFPSSFFDLLSLTLFFFSSSLPLFALLVLFSLAPFLFLLDTLSRFVSESSYCSYAQRQSGRSSKEPESKNPTAASASLPLPIERFGRGGDEAHYSAFDRPHPSLSLCFEGNEFPFFSQ